MITICWNVCLQQMRAEFYSKEVICLLGMKDNKIAFVRREKKAQSYFVKLELSTNVRKAAVRGPALRVNTQTHTH